MRKFILTPRFLKLETTLLISLTFFTQVLFAYIPSSKMILSKLTENNTTGPIYYEQEVVISGSGISAELKEKWFVENDSVMAVLVQGEKELKDKIQFIIQYNGKRRSGSLNLIKANENINADFFEPIFFIKTQQKMNSFIVNAGIVGQEIQDSTNFQRQKEVFTHTPESFVRLGRTAGTIAYVISGQTGIEPGLPGLWVEQDQFLLRKIRNSKKTEMRVEKWGNYSRGWKLPKERAFAWDDKIASVKMLDVKVPQGNIKSTITKAQEARTPEFENSKEKFLIQEFYSRFR
jgi:hypothetical protein